MNIFDLKKGDRIRHGQNFGTVLGQTERGPTILWDRGSLDPVYTEYHHAVHPLHIVQRVSGEITSPVT